MQPCLVRQVPAGKQSAKLRLAVGMYTFKKEERLCSEKLLKKLFNSGSSFLLYPFKVIWLQESLEVPVQLVISVPKRRFKRAVDRNLLKRRIREAYRLNKGALLYPFLKQNNIQILLGITYIGKEIAEYMLIEKKLKALVEQFKRGYNEYNPG